MQGGYGYDESQDYNLIIDAHDPDAVYIQAQPIGIDGGYADAAQTQPMGTLTCSQAVAHTLTPATRSI